MFISIMLLVGALVVYLMKKEVEKHEEIEMKRTVLDTEGMTLIVLGLFTLLGGIPALIEGKSTMPYLVLSGIYFVIGLGYFFYPLAKLKKQQ